MMLWQVFHANNLREVDYLADPPEYPTPNYKNYTWVATVRTPDNMKHFEALDLVFRLTNSIDYSWTENPEIKSRTNRPVRSTSIGDLIVKVDMTDRRLWRVGHPGGFDLLGLADEMWPKLFPPTEEDYDDHYVKDGACPVCGETKAKVNFHWGAFFPLEDTAYGRHVWCGICGAEWDEVYLLGGIKNIKQGDGKPAPLREI